MQTIVTGQFDGRFTFHVEWHIVQYQTELNAADALNSKVFTHERRGGQTQVTHHTSNRGQFDTHARAPQINCGGVTQTGAQARTSCGGSIQLRVQHVVAPLEQGGVGRGERRDQLLHAAQTTPCE